MIIKNHKTIKPALAAALLIVAVCASVMLSTGAKTAYLSAGEALEQLAASVAHHDGQISFQIPEGYENAAAAGTGLDACVSKAILAANAGKYSGGDFATEAHTVFKAVESGSTVTVYAMALYLEFGYTGDTFFGTSGCHTPVAVTFKKDTAGEYTLKEYWMPQDGSRYAPSIREKFPSDICEEAIDTQKYALAHTQCCYAQAIKHGGVPIAVHLAKLVATICSSPAGSSNPRAYIDAHTAEYRELLYCGDYTLRYAFSEFLKGGQTGLESHILLATMRDLLGGEDLGLATGMPQEWFDKWKEHAVRLRDANSMEFMKKNYPKTSILLEMLDQTAS